MYRLLLFYHQYYSLRALTTNYALKFNNFSTTRPISDLNMFLKRVYQKFYLRGNPLEKNSRTLKPKLHKISSLSAFLRFYINYQHLPSGEPIKINYTLNFNNFSTTRPILNLKILLDRAHLNLEHLDTFELIYQCIRH